MQQRTEFPVDKELLRKLSSEMVEERRQLKTDLLSLDKAQALCSYSDHIIKVECVAARVDETLARIADQQLKAEELQLRREELEFATRKFANEPKKRSPRTKSTIRTTLEKAS